MENLIILANEVSQGLFEFWYGKLIIGLIVCAGLAILAGIGLGSYFLIDYIVDKVKKNKRKKAKEKENKNE